MLSWKYRVHAILILSVLAIIFVPQFTNKPDKNKAAAAENAALEFLQMVDAGKYADSWQISDPFLRKTIPVDAWEEKLTKIRETFGELSERSLDDANFTAAAEELPESEFILLEYNSRFALKEMNEIVTVVRGEDNLWRVIGYFIQ